MWSCDYGSRRSKATESSPRLYRCVALWRLGVTNIAVYLCGGSCIVRTYQRKSQSKGRQRSTLSKTAAPDVPRRPERPSDVLRRPRRRQTPSSTFEQTFRFQTPPESVDSVPQRRAELVARATKCNLFQRIELHATNSPKTATFCFFSCAPLAPSTTPVRLRWPRGRSGRPRAPRDAAQCAYRSPRLRLGPLKRPQRRHSQSLQGAWLARVGWMVGWLGVLVGWLVGCVGWFYGGRGGNERRMLVGLNGSTL